MKSTSLFSLTASTAIALFAQGAGAAALTLGNSPLYLSSSVPPLVMLTVSKDHTLFSKAYNDYSDLDGDGQIETTYKHGVDYAGYFDSYKCYTYDTTNNYFAPTNWTDKDRTVSSGAAVNLTAKYCNTGNATAPAGAKATNTWSGNFLNWAAMARIDVMRLVLYGGTRSTDTAVALNAAQTIGGTLLERTYLPNDAHSWSKYYNGADIASLTPFNPGTTRPSSTWSSGSIFGTGNRDIVTAASVSPQLGDQVMVSENAPATPLASTTGSWMVGIVSRVTSSTDFRIRVIAGDTLGSTDPTTSWTVTNLSRTGISFCNTTVATGYSQNVNTSTNPPLIRVVQGNYALWSANEVWQCRFYEEKKETNGGSPNPQSNGNRAVQSQLDASAENPSNTCSSTTGLCVSGKANPDYVARVAACVGVQSGNNLNGEETCKQYTNGNYKPIGLLQTYGDGNLIQYGLMTGSYDHNISGGVLRKNVSSFQNEVNYTTDGTFTAAAASGIVGNLNKLRLYGYNHSSSLYNDTSSSGGDSCRYQLIEIVTSGGDATYTSSPGTANTVNEGGCSNWGNPMSEMFLESLRYFAGKQSDNRFNGAGNNTTSKDTTLGLSAVTTWSDPISLANYCAPMNVMMFNPAVSSYDDVNDNQMNLFSDIVTGSPAAPFNVSMDALTKAIGDSEGITNASWFIGNASGVGNDTCVPKTVTDLSLINGLCPEAPGVNGSYRMAGAAWYAHMNRIRPTFTGGSTGVAPPVADKRSLKVTTYGVQLATNTPKIVVPIPGSPTRTITIQPTYRLDKGSGRFGGGTLVDFKVVAQDLAAGTGTFYINYEDSAFGGDYDQDVWGRLSYCVKTATTTCPAVHPTTASPSGADTPGDDTITITTDMISASTANPQGWGFVISGTTQDGMHFMSGILNLTYNTGTHVDPVTGSAEQQANKGLVGAGAPGFTGVTAGFMPVDSTGVLGCATCVLADGAKSWIFSLSTTSSAGILRDPLYYAAKWGGFNDLNNNNLPDQTTEYDILNQVGQPGTDGLPDNYYFVTNPLALQQSLDRAFIAILTTSSASSVATNTTKLQAGATVYQAKFNSNDWSGTLLALSIDLAGNVNQSTPVWDAAQFMTGPSFDSNARKIITYNPSRTSGSDDGVPFRYCAAAAVSCSGINDVSQRAFLNLDASGASDGVASDSVCTSMNTPSGCKLKGDLRVKYLRGDATFEGATSTLFRVRPNTKLGDIINSTPTYVGAPSKFYFDAGYITFRDSKLDRRPVIYVGGNDGMMHAFDASNLTPGRELLAYVPGPVYRNLTKLTGQTYNNTGSHLYFVDGNPAVGDAFIDPATGGSGTRSWNTVLVGGLNAGGRGVYALNVTNPGNTSGSVAGDFTEANASNLVLWEFSNANDPDLGFTFSTPTIAKMANGKWAAIIGNGYNNSVALSGETACTGRTSLYVQTPSGCRASFDGHASLFIIFLEGGTDGTWTAGTDYIKIDTGVGTQATPAGLASPLAMDIDGDDIVDYVYAGDLQGNMWKFDVSSATPSSWAIAFPSSTGYPNGTPLFTAKDTAGTPNRQPIQDSPEVTVHPSGGQMVFFGTGKYLEPGDDVASATTPYLQQTFYGIWDKQTKLQAGTPVSDRSVLMPQKVYCSGTLGAGQSFIDPTKTCSIAVTGISNQFRLSTSHQPNYGTSNRTDTIVDDNVVATSQGPLSAGSFIVAPQRGWYLDFPNSADATGTWSNTGTGERVKDHPFLSTGKLVFATLIPSNISCELGGSGFIFDLDPMTGARLGTSPIDVNGDGLLNAADLLNLTGSTGGANDIPVSASRNPAAGIPTVPTVIAGTTVASGSSSSSSSTSSSSTSSSSTSSSSTSSSSTSSSSTSSSSTSSSSTSSGGVTTTTCGTGCEIKVISTSSGQVITIRERAGSTGAARLSWRELIQD